MRTFRYDLRAAHSVSKWEHWLYQFTQLPIFCSYQALVSYLTLYRASASQYARHETMVAATAWLQLNQITKQYGCNTSPALTQQLKHCRIASIQYYDLICGLLGLSQMELLHLTGSSLPGLRCFMLCMALFGYAGATQDMKTHRT